jgi:transcriptional regulator with XRE-family HTH domain
VKQRVVIPDSVHTFGEALYWARNQRGITLRQLAQRMGLSAPFLSDCEHDRRCVHSSRMQALADALGVSRGDLETRVGSAKPLADWLAQQPELLELIRKIRRAPPKLILKAVRAATEAIGGNRGATS